MVAINGTRTQAGRWLIAIVIGLFLVISMPIVRADAYVVGPVTDLTTISEQRSVTVHVSEPGRYVLHAALPSSFECRDCEQDSKFVTSDEGMQRFATIEPFAGESPNPAESHLAHLLVDPDNRYIDLESPPPRF